MDKIKNKGTYFAMEYGLILAIYFIIIFSFTVISFQIDFFKYIRGPLTFLLPFIVYWMIKYFRDKQNEGAISFGEAWSIGILLFFFASLPEALCQFVYYKYINPEYIYNVIEQASTMLNAIPESNNNEIIHTYIETFKNSQTPSAIQMAVQGIFNNIFFGGFISLVVALIVKRNKITTE